MRENGFPLEKSASVGEPALRAADITEPLWTVDELAQYLRLEPQTIRTLAREGKLPALKVGRIWRFRRSEVLHALKQPQAESVKEDNALEQIRPGT